MDCFSFSSISAKMQTVGKWHDMARGAEENLCKLISEKFIIFTVHYKMYVCSAGLAVVGAVDGWFMFSFSRFLLEIRRGKGDEN